MDKNKTWVICSGQMRVPIAQLVSASGQMGFYKAKFVFVGKI
jgi:hypothetical protein